MRLLLLVFHVATYLPAGLLAGVFFLLSATPSHSQDVNIQLERMAEFEGGQTALFEYLSNTLQLPPAGEASAGGTVITKFTIDEKGKVGNVEITEGLNEFYNGEALRVIRQMPRWKPALKDGKPVSVQFTLPIRFPPS